MEGDREGGQFVEALGEAEPGRAAMREQEAGSVWELEIGSGGHAGMAGPHRQAGEHEAEGLDGLEHEVDSGVGQDLALRGRFMAEGEVDPTAVSRFCTTAQCSISSLAMAKIT